MTTLSYAVTDTATMLRRNMKHLLRYPTLLIIVIAMPAVFLLLFVYVFGGTLGNGLGGLSGGRAAYVNYVTPAIIMLTIASAVQSTAISVASDMTEGIIARFRTMSIARSSVLTGHVIASMILSVVGVVVLIGISIGVGFRPSASVVDWLAAAGIILLVSFALTWLSVALGLAAKSVETASNTPMFLLLLPFLGSGFVPTSSMPTVLRWFAQYQPFTPVNETIRGLLMGTRIGNDGIITVVWCVGIAALSYVWARRKYDRKPVQA